MTKIEWCWRPGTKGESWNPIVAYDEDGRRGWHCEKVSDGCKLCYAEARNKSGRCNTGTKLLFTPASRKKVRIELHEPTLLKPLHWRDPRTIFVCSMSDLYGEWVPFDWLDRIKAIEALCPQHTFIELTKRPERMAEYLSDPDRVIDGIADAWLAHVGRYLGPLLSEVEEWCRKNNVSMAERDRRVGAINDHTARWYMRHNRFDHRDNPSLWALPNAWLGTSCEDQPTADERIPHLLRCPAAVRFLSCEPLLGAIRLPTITDLGEDIDDDEERRAYGLPETIIGDCLVNVGPRRIHWVIIGGESGPDARPCDIVWIRSIRDQCQAVGVPCFVKQLGAKPIDSGHQCRKHYPGHCGLCNGLRDPKGGNPSEWPEDLRVREWPAVATTTQEQPA